MILQHIYIFVLSEDLKTSLRSRTTVFPGFAGTFSFGARLTPLNRTSFEKRSQHFSGFCHSPFLAYRTFRVGFYTDEVRHCLVSSVFYLFSKKIKGGQNELVKSPKMIAMTALIRVISF